MDTLHFVVCYIGSNVVRDVASCPVFKLSRTVKC